VFSPRLRISLIYLIPAQKFWLKQAELQFNMSKKVLILGQIVDVWTQRKHPRFLSLITTRRLSIKDSNRIKIFTWRRTMRLRAMHTWFSFRLKFRSDSPALIDITHLSQDQGVLKLWRRSNYSPPYTNRSRSVQAVAPKFGRNRVLGSRSQRGHIRGCVELLIHYGNT